MKLFVFVQTSRWLKTWGECCPVQAVPYWPISKKKRKCLFAHSVCGRSVLFAHSVCGRNELFAHSPGYLLSCNYMILCNPAAAAATSAEKILSLWMSQNSKLMWMALSDTQDGCQRRLWPMPIAHSNFNIMVDQTQERMLSWGCLMQFGWRRRWWWWRRWAGRYCWGMLEEDKEGMRWEGGWALSRIVMLIILTNTDQVQPWGGRV